MPVELSVMRSSILAVLTGTTLLLGACSAPSDDDALKAAPEQATTGQNTAAEATTATEKQLPSPMNLRWKITSFLQT